MAKKLDSKQAAGYFVNEITDWNTRVKDIRLSKFEGGTKLSNYFIDEANKSNLFEEFELFLERTSNLVTFNLFRYFDGEIENVSPIELFISWIEDDIDEWEIAKVSPNFTSAYLKKIDCSRELIESSLFSSRFQAVKIPKPSVINSNYVVLFELLWRQTFAIILEQIEKNTSERLQEFLGRFSASNLAFYFVHVVCIEMFYSILYPSQFDGNFHPYVNFGSQTEEAEYLANDLFKEVRDNLLWPEFIGPLRYVLRNDDEEEATPEMNRLSTLLDGQFYRESSDKHFFLDLAQWSIEITPIIESNESSKVLSKFGGYPNLPDSYEWPTFQGYPMSFIAQINLSEIPLPIGCDLPSKGFLFFFYDSQKASGLVKSSTGSCQVFFVEDELVTPSKVRRVKEEIDDDEASFDRVIFSECQLSFQKKMMLPPMGCPELNLQQVEWDTFGPLEENIDYQNEDEVTYSDLWWEHINTTNYLLGYPSEQLWGDPRFNCYRASSDEIVKSREIRGAELEKLQKIGENRLVNRNEAPEEWKLLLQFQPYDSSDDGRYSKSNRRIYFMIHRDDLKFRDFSRVWVAAEDD